MSNFTGKNIAYLALGSSLGCRFSQLSTSLHLISQFANIKDISRLYITKPIPVQGYYNNNQFVNLCVKVTLKEMLSPLMLLQKVKEIESNMGRMERGRWHNREIDIDIILFDDAEINTPELTIPHPEMQNRDFVMKPLLDIYPKYQKFHQNTSTDCILFSLPNKVLQFI